MVTNGVVEGYGSDDVTRDGLTGVHGASVHNLTNVSHIAVSSDYMAHVLARKLDGTVVAWGSNDCGQLGDTTTINRDAPVEVYIPFNVMSVAAGNRWSLAVDEYGVVWSWGDNSCGQLGDETTTGRLVSTPILADIVHVAAGNYHALALDADGSIWAWGSNAHGQIGDGTTTNKYSPVQIFVASAPPYTLPLTITNASEYIITVNASNISSFIGTEFTITYDTTALQLMDFAAQTGDLTITASQTTILGTSLKLKSHSSGKLVFEVVNKTIPTGKVWSGVLTLLKFKAKKTGSTSITIS
jgi:hypothetical protein